MQLGSRRGSPRKKQFFFLLVSVAGMAAIAALVAGCGGSYSSGSQPPSHRYSHSTHRYEPTQAASHVATKRVMIVDKSNGTFAFSPARITIKKGTKVTWDNTSSTQHTVTFSKHNSIASINPGQKESLTFKKTGKFSYHCTIHPFMTGVVTVKK